MASSYIPVDGHQLPTGALAPGELANAHHDASTFQPTRWPRFNRALASFLNVIGRIGDKPESQSRYIRVHMAVSILCAACMALFGYDQGVFGGVIVGNKFVEAFDDPSPSVVGFVTSIFDIGCFIGSIITMAVGDAFGRKRCMYLGAIIMGGGAIFQVISWAIIVLSWSRAITGVGIGIMTATAPLYHSEMVKAHMRGKAVVIELLINIVGYVVSNWTTLAFSHWRTTTLQWRIPLGIQLVFVVVIIFIIRYCPESPRWLVMCGRNKEAAAVLERLFPGESSHIQELVESVERDRKLDSVGWLDLVKWKTELAASRRLVLGVALQGMQQLSGINIICYYLPLVLQKSVGMPEETSRIVAAFNSILYMVAAAIPLLFIERFGRRPLLLSASFLQALCFLVVTIALSFGGNKAAGIVATVAFCAFFFFFGGLGFLAIPWLYPAEINTAILRTKGSALATASDWIFNYLIVQITPVGIHQLQWRFYMIFMFVNFAICILLYLFFPETAGRTLEEINDMFRTNDTVFVQRMGHVRRGAAQRPRGPSFGGARRFKTGKAPHGAGDEGSEDLDVMLERLDGRGRARDEFDDDDIERDVYGIGEGDDDYDGLSGGGRAHRYSDDSAGIDEYKHLRLDNDRDDDAESLDDRSLTGGEREAKA